jgi:hypothetical protein
MYHGCLAQRQLYLDNCYVYILQNSSPAKSNANATQQGSGKGQGDLLHGILEGNAVPVVCGDDDFNPRASENSLASPGGEFGDFTSAFGKPALSKTRYILLK